MAGHFETSKAVEELQPVSAQKKRVMAQNYREATIPPVCPQQPSNYRI